MTQSIFKAQSGNAELEAKAQAFAEKHNLTYADAYVKVSELNPALLEKAMTETPDVQAQVQKSFPVTPVTTFVQCRDVADIQRDLAQVNEDIGDAITKGRASLDESSFPSRLTKNVSDSSLIPSELSLRKAELECELETANDPVQKAANEKVFGKRLLQIKAALEAEPSEETQEKLVAERKKLRAKMKPLDASAPGYDAMMKSVSAPKTAEEDEWVCVPVDELADKALDALEVGGDDLLKHTTLESDNLPMFKRIEELIEDEAEIEKQLPAEYYVGLRDLYKDFRKGSTGDDPVWNFLVNRAPETVRKSAATIEEIGMTGPNRHHVPIMVRNDGTSFDKSASGSFVKCYSA